MTKRVLIISYAFPPIGGVGVQRMTKFTKYLGDFGWQPSVLTVANPSVPAYDHKMLTEVPANVIVRRARSWEPSYAMKARVAANGSGSKNAGGQRGRLKGMARGLSNLVLQPDPQVLWNHNAARAGMELLNELPHQAILVSGPPFSSFLLGARLSRAARLPLIVDYRDEWSISNEYWENKRQHWLARMIQQRQEHRVLRAARMVLATTRASAAALVEIRNQAKSDCAVSWIYNGYDPSDGVENLPPREQSRPFQLAYIGTLWKLTSVAPLVAGLRQLSQLHPELARQLELVVAGRRTAEQNQVLTQVDPLPCQLRKHDFVEHDRAIEMQQHADLLCVMQSDLPHAGRVVSAKVFEYMATRRPILAIAPVGELWDVLQDYPAAHLFTPDDTEGIATFLARQIADRDQPSAADFSRWDGLRFDRRYHVGQLAGILDRLLSDQPLPQMIAPPSLFESKDHSCQSSGSH